MEEQACVIISGSVQLRNHSKSQGKVAEVFATYGPGAVLGLPEIDKGITMNTDSFLMTATEVEVIMLPKKTLLELWPLQGQETTNALLYETVVM